MNVAANTASYMQMKQRNVKQIGCGPAHTVLTCVLGNPNSSGQLKVRQFTPGIIISLHFYGELVTHRNGLFKNVQTQWAKPACVIWVPHFRLHRGMSAECFNLAEDKLACTWLKEKRPYEDQISDVNIDMNYVIEIKNCYFMDLTVEVFSQMLLPKSRMNFQRDFSSQHELEFLRKLHPLGS